MIQPISTQQAIANATASLEMEGFTVSTQQKELAERLLNKEITKEQYIELTLKLIKSKK